MSLSMASLTHLAVFDWQIVLEIKYSYPIWLFLANFGQVWPKFGPTLVHLTHFVIDCFLEA
jgi:hypothetical protein